MTNQDPTKRFSDRVDNYVKFRPGYPTALLEFLQKELPLQEDAVIADIGAGTGIFSKMLLENGFLVYAVEPNQPMLDEAIHQLSHYKKFIPISGSAESSGIPDRAIDLISCAQSFHWFNNEKTRIEFKRILKPDAKVALIWNARLKSVDDFAVDYDNLLKEKSIDYTSVNHQNLKEEDFKAFYKNGIYKLNIFRNVQVFDEEGLIGRAYSSSYVPGRYTPEGEKFLDSLKKIFSLHQVNGKVSFHYNTELYLGEL